MNILFILHSIDFYLFLFLNLTSCFLFFFSIFAIRLAFLVQSSTFFYRESDIYFYTHFLKIKRMILLDYAFFIHAFDVDVLLIALVSYQ